MRRTGKSYAHPFIVLAASPNALPISRFGFTAGRSLGNAVQRNRAKRRLRHLVQDFHEQILPGWDIVLIARESCLTAPWPELRQAFRELSQRANLLARMENDYVN